MQKLKAIPRHSFKLGRNQMLFDMGYPANISIDGLRTAISTMDSLFDLVMVSEFMDESLVLLRHLLCWSVHDVVVFAKNERRNEVKPALNPVAVKAIRELNSADSILYNHFLAKHRLAVQLFGVEKMEQEVFEMRSLRAKYFKACGARKVKGQDSGVVFKEYSPLVSTYHTTNMKNVSCFFLSLPELQLVDTVREKQKKLLSHTFS